jgi:hypothetical protein
MRVIASRREHAGLYDGVEGAKSITVMLSRHGRDTTLTKWDVPPFAYGLPMTGRNSESEPSPGVPR